MHHRANSAEPAAAVSGATPALLLLSANAKTLAQAKHASMMRTDIVATQPMVGRGELCSVCSALGCRLASSVLQ